MAKHKFANLLFCVTVLAVAIVQQLGQPRHCSVCRLSAVPASYPRQFGQPLSTLVSFTAAMTVTNDAELRTAVANLQPGSTLRIAPGEYRGGHAVRGIARLTIEAADAQRPPTFLDGGNAWHFSACAELKVRHMIFKGQTGNGINIDDGGLATPTIDTTLEHLQIIDIGPKGNHDGIKLSGLDRFTVSACSIQGWGGQGIDMVGCHHGLIKKCRFEGKPGFSASAGVQTKGGSADIVIEDCEFKEAGERPLNIGGSTGLEYFRPKDAAYEAARIIARRNRIEGSLSSVAFVGVDGAEFSDNTLLYPKKWIMRILQETSGERFVPCRNVKVINNRIAFRRSEVQIECNVGGGTAADSFEFRGNHWFAQDRPDRSKPRLPVEETNGHYGLDWTK